MKPLPESAGPSVRAEEISSALPEAASLRSRWLNEMLPWCASLMVHVGALVLGFVAARAILIPPTVVLHEDQPTIPDSELHDAAMALPTPMTNKGLEELLRDASQDRDPDHASNGGSEFQGKKQDFSMGGGEGSESPSDLIARGAGLLQPRFGTNGIGTGHRTGDGPGDGGELARFGLRLPGGTKTFRLDGARRLVFVCDATGTMINKLASLKEELVRVISGLRGSQSFNVIFYTDGGKVLIASPEGLMLATPDNKRRAIGFMSDVTPIGTTDPIPAIQAAFKQNAQLIYFLSDGEFNNLKSYEQVTQEFKKLNTSEVKVNTILFETFDAEAEQVMERIAREGHGTYRYVKESDLE